MISAQKDGSREMKLRKSYIVSFVMVGDEGSVGAEGRWGGPEDSSALTGTWSEGVWGWMESDSLFRKM